MFVSNLFNYLFSAISFFLIVKLQPFRMGKLEFYRYSGMLISILVGLQTQLSFVSALSLIVHKKRFEVTH